MKVNVTLRFACWQDCWFPEVATVVSRHDLDTTVRFSRDPVGKRRMKKQIGGKGIQEGFPLNSL